MTHQPHSILLDKDLREKGLIAPVSQYVHDAMHALASSGALHTVVYLFLSALQAAKVPIYSLLADYINAWTLPKQHAFQISQLTKLFTSKKAEGYRIHSSL